MKKKIFFIMSTNDYSGAENVNFTIIENLKEKYDFYWVSRKGNINYYLKEKNIKWIEIEKLCVKEIKRVVKKYKPDILHATDYKASVICSLAGVNAKIIAHLHNNSPWLKKFGINSIAFLYAGLRVDKILTVSESIENEYIFSGLIKDKIYCISNPISRKKVLNNVKENDYEKKYDICCCARLTKAKNPYKFLNILSNLKDTNNDVRAIWIGDGELKDDIKKRTKELNIESNIDFVGFQKNPYKYMAQSKIFMLTSDWEGFGLVAFEALTLGLPCVVSNVGGLVDIVDSSCGKLCERNEEFENEINKLLTDKNYYEEKKFNSKKRAEKIENIDEYMEKILNIYDNKTGEKNEI